MSADFKVSDYSSDPDFLRFFDRCGCGVLDSTARAFHQTANHACRHHDLGKCRECASEVLARYQLDELLPEIERRLRAEAEHGPFLVRKK